MKKRAAVLLGLSLGGLLAVPAFAATEGQWIENGTKFQKADGSLARNEWIEGENNSFFYVGADGSFVTGWHNIKEQNSDATHDYYFNPADGAMFYDTYTPDGYWVNADGVATGKVKDGSLSDKPETGTAGSDAETAAQETAAEEQSGAQPAETETAAGQEAAATEQDSSDKQDNSAETQAAGQNEPSVDTSASGTAGAGSEPQQIEPGVIMDGYSANNADHLIALINQKRAEAGKPALSVDADLQKAAEVRAKEIADYPDDSRIYLRPEKHYLAEAKDTSRSMVDSSVTAVTEEARKAFTRGSSILITESVAWGVQTPQEAVDDWFAKNSDGEDKSNKSFILDTGNNGFNAIGASCYLKDGKQYYSLFLGVRQ